MTERKREQWLAALPPWMTGFLFLPRPTKTFSELHGTRAIAKYVLGEDNRAAMRAMYNILATSATIPATKSGGIWHVDLVALNAKIWLQERQAFTNESEEQLAQLYIILTTLQPLLAACGIQTEHGALAPADYVDEAVKIIDRVLGPRKL